MNEPDVKRIDMIQKLMAKANNTDNEIEAETYRNKATDLIALWELDEVLLKGHQRAGVENIEVVFIEVPGPKIYAHEMVRLGTGMAGAMGMRGVINKRDKRRDNLMLVGFTSDIKRFREVYDFIAIQAQLALATWYKKEVPNWYSASQKYNAKRSFLMGFATAIRNRLKASRARVVSEATAGTDLVLADRGDQLDQFLEDNYRLKNTRKQYGNGVDDGMKAGARADLGQTKFSANARALGNGA